MKRRITKLAFYPAMVFLVVSCVTINIYFPAAAVEKAAEDIVEEVWGSVDVPAVPAEPDKAGEPSSFRLKGFNHKHITLGFGATPAYAKDANINVTTPAIRSLKSSIQRRSASLMPYLDKGNVGITKDGLLMVRNNNGLNLKNKAALKRLVSSENRDRDSLYSEIARANDIGPDKIPEIKKLFAKSWINNARRGWFVQGAGGAWSAK